MLENGRGGGGPPDEGEGPRQARRSPDRTASTSTGDTALVVVFSGQIQFKAWLTTLVIVLALVQVGSAL